MALSLSRTSAGTVSLRSSLPGNVLCVVEGIVHLVARDVGRLAGLLDVHAELDDVEEELEEVLVLRVAALDGEGEERPPVLQGQARASASPAAFFRAR